jgi:F-type H+-transporting ATPase subunit b
MHVLTIIASAARTSGESQGLLQALGIDWKLLVEQAIAFLILVAILAKFVYPVLMKSVDTRREAIEAGLKEAKESQEASERAQAETGKLLEAARREADDIIARSAQEANALVAEAEEKAKTRAEQIVADARTQLAADVSKARQTLKADTIKLVAVATEQVIGEKLDAAKDAKLIQNALDQEKA